MKYRVGLTSVQRRYHVGAQRAVRFALFNLCAVGLLACAPAAVETFRDQTAPIGQTVRYSAQDMAGLWHVQAYFGAAAPATVSFDAGSEHMSAGGARYAMGSEGLVVMWVDEGFRTAAVGRVDGSLAWILDREPAVASDRTVAATQVLEFYGWDIARLVSQS